MILEYNLQFFAKEGPGGEKTEPATEKKLKDARKKGQVAKSKEIANGLSLLGLFILMKVWAGTLGTGLLELFAGFYNRIPETVQMAAGTVPTGNLDVLLKNAVLRIMLLVAPVFATGFLIAFISDVAQVKWEPTAEPLKPKLDRLNPISGFKKIFSLNSLAELVKSILKILVIGFVSYKYVMANKETYLVLMDLPLLSALKVAGDLVINLGIRISAIFMIVALGDFAFQKWKFAEDMKMTKQEIKDELKESEGNPEIKGKQRQRMQEASRRRMMQSVPQADVVITNPTHFAVAIKYDGETNEAPVVLAKGADYLAQKIKEIAKDNKVELVENKPLARMLYHNVEVGQEIPPELYPAVAEVLAYVYKLQGKI